MIGSRMSDQSATHKIWKIRGKSSWKLLDSGSFFSAHGLWARYSYDCENPQSPVRLAVVVSRKYGHSPARNTFKRRIKASLHNDEYKKMFQGHVVMIGVNKKMSSPINFKTIQLFIEELTQSFQVEKQGSHEHLATKN